MDSAPTLRRATTKSGLILRDTLVFLALTGISIALFLVTLGLFRSFEDHRQELGRRWAERGKQALAANHPDEAVSALRTALTYQDSLPDQLLLAQALAASGHTEEATNYFLNLRETRPGDGFLNLQLARLSRQERDVQQAENYYRASIYGNWEGDGALRRRDVRLELAQYLAANHDLAGARDELLTAAGNSPDTPETDLLFARQLSAVSDAQDALTWYGKALKLDPRNHEALAGAGRLNYQLGQYSEANRLLTEALAHEPPHPAPALAAENKQLAEMAANARRVPELTLTRELPASLRAEHLLTAATIVQRRLNTCIAPAAPQANPVSQAPAVVPPTSLPNPALQALKSRWVALQPQLNHRALARDAELEDSVEQLVNDTEQGTLGTCGAPSGDDALLLMLAHSYNAAH